MRRDFDLVVVGGGPGVLPAVTEAIQRNLSVCVIDRNALPDGSIPSGNSPRKLILEAMSRGEYPSTPGPMWDKIKTSLFYKFDKSFDVAVCRGYGQLWDDNSVEIVTGEHRGELVTGEKLLLETGSSPQELNIPLHSDVDSYDNRTIQHTDPNDITVIGSGIEAIEWSTILSLTGADTTLLCDTERLLPSLPDYLNSVAMRHFESLGVDLYTNICLNRKVIENLNNKTDESDAILNILSESPHTGKIRTKNAGVELTPSRHVAVNEAYQSSSSTILAVGDVSSSPGETNIAAAKEGRIAVENAFSGTTRSTNYDALPHIIYTNPQIFFTGRPSRVNADEANISYCLKQKQVPRSPLDSKVGGQITVVADRQTKRLNKVFGYGLNSSSIVSEAALAIQLNLTIEDIAETIHPFPETTESLRYACEKLSEF